MLRLTVCIYESARPVPRHIRCNSSRPALTIRCQPPPQIIVGSFSRKCHGTALKLMMLCTSICVVDTGRPRIKRGYFPILLKGKVVLTVSCTHESGLNTSAEMGVLGLLF